ncbi:MAG: hypothetical protein FWC26_01750 [Fibromonadales bacterium]|nr:hypothetical protein [Fibromonadales bacterium]
MTDKELKDLVASLAVSSKETDRLIKEIGLQMKETDRRMEETDRQIQETDRQLKERMKETSLEIDRVSKKMGGISDNIGYHAEQFFQRVFEKKLKFGNVKYDEMIPNLCYRDKNAEIEFDIALINGDSIALIEVKNRIHPAFVNEFAETRVKKFRKFFPHYKDYKVYLGIAGFSFCEEVIHRASQYGIGIIGQKGDSVEVKGKLKAF